MATKYRKTPSSAKVLPKPVPPPKDTREAKLLLSFLCGLFVLALIGCFSFNKKEYFEFGMFLRGQTGIDLGVLFSSSVFWKLTFGFGIGAVGGYLLSVMVNPGNIQFANKVARYSAVFLITLLIYIPAMSAAYIWDDDQEVHANVALRDFHGLVQAWKGAPGTGADYLPLKTTMLWVEYQIWGAKPEGYHVMNIVVHAIAALLLIVALKQLRIPGAWLAGLLFAIHPVHVESVAWVSERKNTLSLVFYLLTFIAYFKFDRTKNWAYYGWALAAFVAAGLCKSHVVVLPAALVLCNWWQRRGFTKEDLLRSIPFFVLSGFFAWLTIHFQFQRAIGGEVIENFGGWGSRIAMAGMSTWWYLYKALCPDHLITIYPIWPIIPPQAYQFLFGIALLVVLAVLWFYRNSWARPYFFAFAYFVATLVPVMGFIKMSYMRVTLVADHFQYLSDISIIALVSAGIALLYQRLGQWGRYSLVGVVAVLVMTFSGYSWNRAGTFQCEETLWLDTLSKNENTWQAHNHMGAIYYSRQDFSRARHHFYRGVQLRPGNCEVQNNMGLVLMAMGELDSALEYYKRAVEIKPDDASIRTNYGNGLAMAKKFSEAVVQYREAVKYPSPNKPAIYFQLGNILFQVSRFREAVDAYEEALKLAPQFKEARNNLEAAQRMLGESAQLPFAAPSATPR